LSIQRKRVATRPSNAIPSAPVGRLRRLRRSELPEDTVELARFLIGKVLVRDHLGDRTSGRIVETEAYPVGDAAGHAFIGMTAANHSLFLGKGHAYIYFIYGSHYMCNVAAERRGVGAGVLLQLTAGRPERTALLSTRDADSPARRLYRGTGFTDLLTGFAFFPGGEPPYAVMGAELPLRTRSARPRRW